MGKKRIFTLGVFLVIDGILIYILFYLISLLLISSLNPIKLFFVLWAIILTYYGSKIYTPYAKMYFQAIITGNTQILEKTILKNTKITVNNKHINYKKDSLIYIIGLELIFTLLLTGAIILIYVNFAKINSTILSFQTSEKILSLIFIIVPIVGSIKSLIKK